jgi:hypothetical protein
LHSKIPRDISPTLPMTEKTMTQYRVFLAYDQDPDDEPLLVQLRLDEQGNAVREMGFGICGKPGDREDCYPFVLWNASTIDFGSSYEEATERYWSILWSGPVTVGGLVIVRVEEENYDYRIKSVERVN